MHVWKGGWCSPKHFPSFLPRSLRSERKPINSTQVAKQICFAVKCAKSISYLANIFISMCSLSIQLHLNKILIESVDWEAYYSIDNFLAGKSLYLVWNQYGASSYDVTLSRINLIIGRLLSYLNPKNISIGY